MNPTVSQYLSKHLLPAIEYGLTEVLFTQLLSEINGSHELNKWKEFKEESYHRERREKKKRQKEEMGESVTESEEWEDSEMSEEEHKQGEDPPFDPLTVLAAKLREFKTMKSD